MPLSTLSRSIEGQVAIVTGAAGRWRAHHKKCLISIVTPQGNGTQKHVPDTLHQSKDSGRYSLIQEALRFSRKAAIPSAPSSDWNIFTLHSEHSAKSSSRVAFDCRRTSFLH